MIRTIRKTYQNLLLSAFWSPITQFCFFLKIAINPAVLMFASCFLCQNIQREKLYNWGKFHVILSLFKKQTRIFLEIKVKITNIKILLIFAIIMVEYCFDHQNDSLNLHFPKFRLKKSLSVFHWSNYEILFFSRFRDILRLNNAVNLFRPLTCSFLSAL